MSKLLVVFGATGQQGGSVVHFVLNDPELSKQFSIRGVTRDPSTSTSEALKQQNVQVVKADLNDDSSLQSALKGAHTVFAVTAPTSDTNAKAKEVAQGKALADAAVAQGAHYMIFSSLPHVSTISGGNYTEVAGFDAKAEIQDYILTLPIKSAFFAPGSFMQNFQNAMAVKPTSNGDYIMTRHVSPQTQLPLIDTVGDTGKFVGAILAEPERYEGKTFCAATALYSMEEIAQIIGKVSGKTVRYQQIPEAQFRKLISFLPWADGLVQMMLYQQDFGYYGPETKEAVAWAAVNARGKVNTFEEYLTQNPLKLK